jgi:hypothetical protein
MLFNLSDLLQRVDNLEQLEAPFSKEEIDSIIKTCPLKNHLDRMDLIQIF